MDIRGLVIYRNLKHQTLFEQMAGLMGMSEEKESTDSFACAGQLIELAAKYGFEGNLWHCFLALCLADNENAYTTACEVKGPAGGTLDLLAKEDFAIFKALFDFDLSYLAPSSLWSLLADYRPALQEEPVLTAGSRTGSWSWQRPWSRHLTWKDFSRLWWNFTGDTGREPLD